MGKIIMNVAKPEGLVVKCPHCGRDNEVEWDDLQTTGVSCCWIDCGEEFSTCSDSDFIEYIKSGVK